MSPGLMLRRITLPAMLPFAIPGLANLWLIATKDTALLADRRLHRTDPGDAQAAGATKAYFTFFMAAGALYLARHAGFERRSSRASSAGRGAACRRSRGRADERPAASRHRRRAARASLWLQPHRIVLIADRHRAGRCGAPSSCAGTGSRNIAELALQGLWRTIWILVVTCVLGIMLAVPLGLAQAAGPPGSLGRRRPSAPSSAARRCCCSSGCSITGWVRCSRNFPGSATRICGLISGRPGPTPFCR